ncbi:DUF2934 domain-containing protein [Paraburkholderia sp. PREW-6R]|uniref:DUF2934 domain-containing protein n=1 Tax=Paraburkholderia sp. PREW-6R TaxID=3141544 RepID=UPI0031F5776A
MNEDLEARIRTRAYHLWENDASPDGRADEYWEKARRQLEAEGDPDLNAPAPAVEQSDQYNAIGMRAEESDKSEDIADT